MSEIVPEDAQRLARRLRMLADEVESAARYGVPIPFQFTVAGHIHAGATFSATEKEFAAWAEYTAATVDGYEHNGAQWSTTRVDVNGLPLSFAVRHESAAGVPA